MARARNIKPGFFKNEVLGVADPLYSLLFEGLWVLADRAGKLEDRPLRIKGEVFPYREGLDMEAMLDWLHAHSFIRRYQVGSKKYILVLEFVKHQNPHKNETESEIPDPEEIGTTSEIIGSTRADSLSSDSGFLIPDCSLPESEVVATATKPKKTKARSAFPEDFSPNDAGIAAAAGLSLSAELAAFRNHHLAQGGLMADWQAAFRTWCGKAHKFAKPGAEPAWRTEQRERTQIAAPGVAAQPATDFFMEQKNGTSNRLGGPDIRQADGDVRAGLPAPLGRH